MISINAVWGASEIQRYNHLGCFFKLLVYDGINYLWIGFAWWMSLSFLGGSFNHLYKTRKLWIFHPFFSVHVMLQLTLGDVMNLTWTWKNSPRNSLNLEDFISKEKPYSRKGKLEFFFFFCQHFDRWLVIIWWRFLFINCVFFWFIWWLRIQWNILKIWPIWGKPAWNPLKPVGERPRRVGMETPPKCPTLVLFKMLDNRRKSKINRTLGGGFKYFLFSPLPGEDSQFD